MNTAVVSYFIYKIKSAAMDINSEILQFVENENFIPTTGDVTRVNLWTLRMFIG